MLSNGYIGTYKKIVMKCGTTDLRAGINSLSLQLSMLYNVDFSAEEGTLYLFCGNTRKRVKGLIYTSEGFMLVNIQFDMKSVKWITDSIELREITEEQLQNVMRYGKTD